jgi:hypothetical protein
MADIFISYSRQDLTRVRPLANALSSHGWSVWWDPEIPAGRVFDQVIADALADARCVVVVWSKESIASNWVREEADEGRRRGILIPVLLDNVRPPLGFGRIQAVDLGEWDSSDAAPVFRKLVTDIAAVLDPLQAHGTQATVSSMARRRSTPAFAARHATAIKWSLAAVPVLAVLAWGVYGRGEGNARSSRSPSVAAAPVQSALLLNAAMNEGGDALAAGVNYAVYEVAQSTDGHRKRLFSAAEQHGPARFALPVGRYYVTAAYGNAAAGMEVDVTTGAVEAQTLNLHAGILNVSSRLAAGTPPLTSGVHYTVYEAAMGLDGSRKRVSSSPGHEGPSRFVLAAGRYYVTAVYGNAEAGTEVDLVAGDIKAQTVDLGAGILNLSSVPAVRTVQPTGVNYAVYEAAKAVDGSRKRVSASPGHEGPSRFALPAGRYYVTAASDAGTGEREIAIAAGQVRAVQLRLTRAQPR